MSQEEQLVILLKKSPKEAIPVLYDKYGGNLYGILLSILKDEEDAQEALQQSFIKIWQKAALYDPDKSKLFTWLLSISRHTALDLLRKKGRTVQREIRMDLSDVYNKEGKELKPELMDMRDHIMTLEIKYQNVLEALYFQGMTQKEASEALELPLGTIKTRLRIAMRELRRIFGAETLALLALISSIR